MNFNYMTELSATILELIYENNKDSVILLLKIINQSMENINKLIEKNTWNFTISPGNGQFYYCRHVYFHCYGIFVNTLD